MLLHKDLITLFCFKRMFIQNLLQSFYTMAFWQCLLAVVSSYNTQRKVGLSDLTVTIFRKSVSAIQLKEKIVDPSVECILLFASLP